MKNRILALASASLLFTVSCVGGLSSSLQLARTQSAKPEQPASSPPSSKPTAITTRGPTQAPSTPLTSSPRAFDPCAIRDLKSAPAPDLRRVFFDNDASFQEFENEFKTRRVDALKKWLVSTATLSGVKASDIEVQPISQEGRQNMGVYRVVVASDGRSYILKLGEHSAEAINMWRLRNSAVGHPECWNGRKGSEFFPRFVTIYEAATFPTGAPSHIWDGNTVLILMEPAPGNTLDTLRKQSTSKSWDPYRVIGRSIGTMHYFMASNPNAPMEDWITLGHGDLHIQNVLLDEQNRVTLIDFLKIESEAGIEYDIIQLAEIPPFYYHFMLELLEKVYSNELVRLGKSEASPWAKEPDSMEKGDALISALSQPKVREEISKTEPFQKFFQRFDEFRSFVLGYLEALPDSKRADASHYFGARCRSDLEVLTEKFYINRRDKDVIRARLEELVKASMTPAFINCMRDQFDEMR